MVDCIVVIRRDPGGQGERGSCAEAMELLGNGNRRKVPGNGNR